MRRLGVFSGGGGVGLCAHTGALLACEDLGLGFDEVHGTSAGGLAAMCYGLGVPPRVLEHYLRSLPEDAIECPKKGWKLRLRGPSWYRIEYSVHRPDNALKHIQGILRSATRSFDRSSQPVPMKVWAVDLFSGSKVDVISTTLPYDLCALSTMSAPPFLPPVPLGESKLLIDGGVRFNLPLPEDIKNFDQILVFDTSGQYRYRAGSDVLTSLYNTVKIALADQSLDQLERVAEGLGDRVKVISLKFSPTGGLLRLNKSVISGAQSAAAHQLRVLLGM